MDPPYRAGRAGEEDHRWAGVHLTVRQRASDQRADRGPGSLSVAPDGALTILERGTVRKLEPDGFIHSIIGNPFAGACIKEGELAKTSTLYFPTSAIGGSDGSIYIFGGGGDARIFRVAPALPGLTLGEFYLPSSDGSALYVFGVDGRHARTLDATTLHAIHRFQYDSTGRLASITDDVGLVTRINPGASGSSVAIVSGRGVQTTVQLDANGFANRLQGPQGYVVTPTHDSTGLLRELRDERGLPHRFEYDSLGKLTLDADTLGVQSILSYVTGMKNVVTHTNAVGEATTYTVELALDETVTQTTTRTGQKPDSSVFAANGTRELRLPGSTKVTSTLAPDQRFGMAASLVQSSIQRTGVGINVTTTRSRRKIGGSSDPMVRSGLLLDTTRVNGRLYLDSLDLTGQRAVFVSPQGRRSIVQFDSLGRVMTKQSWSR
ncbi:MAG: hypothetical protein LH471_05105, partial [Salinibacterium sp.]|nr:hypothetical protein [Salinibacterium sp.]